MPFNSKAFLKEKFTPRTEDVPVPDLKAFFAEDEVPVWKIRGLTGQEVGRASEAAERNKNIIAILDGLVSGAAKEKSDAVKQLMGVAGNVPDDIAKRIEHLVIGSVEPTCTPDLAVRLCETFPIEFYTITNAIMKLTGQGHVPGKQKPSGGTEKSDQASRSATTEGDSSMKRGRTSSPKAT